MPRDLTKSYSQDVPVFVCMYDTERQGLQSLPVEVPVKKKKKG